MAIGLALMSIIYPQKSAADGLTGRDFAAWSEASQESYIQTSVTMAGVVFAQTEPDVSACIDQWYFPEGVRPERNAEIGRTIGAYPDYHPSGTLLAVLLQACPRAAN